MVLVVTTSFAQIVSIPTTPQNVKVRLLDPTRALSSNTIDTWTIKDGLPLEHVHGLCQTEDGYLWLNSGKSLTRFDGIRFQKIPTIPLGNNKEDVFIGKMVAGNNNSLWCLGFLQDSTYLCQYHNGKWKTFYVCKSKTVYGTSLICDKYNSNKRLWMLIDHALMRFEDGQVSLVSSKADGWSSTRFEAIALDSSANLFAIGKREFSDKKVENILYCLQNGQVKKIYTQAMGLVEHPKNQPRWHSYFSLHNNNSGCWVYCTKMISKDKLRTIVQGVKNDHIETFSDVEGEKSVGKSIGTLTNDGVFYTLNSQGLHRYFDGQWELINNVEFQLGYLAANQQPIIIDREGALWTSISSRLTRVIKPYFTYNNNKNIMSTESFIRNSVVKGNDSLLFATYLTGIIICHYGRISLMGRKDGLLSDTVNVLSKDSLGQIWIGFNAGLQVLTRDGKFKTFTQKNGLFNNRVSSFLHDDIGNTWISSRGGIQVFHPNKRQFLTVLDTRKSGITPLYLSCIDKSGYLWFVGFTREGTEIRGAINSNNYKIPEPEIKVYKPEDGFMNGYGFEEIQSWGKTAWAVGIKDTIIQMTHNGLKKVALGEVGFAIDIFIENDTTMWVITTKGLVRVLENNIRYKPMECLTPNDIFDEILFTKDGYCWLIGKRKVYKVRSKDLHERFTDKEKAQKIYLPISGEYSTGVQDGSASLSLPYVVVKGRYDFSILDLRDSRSNELPPSVIIEEAIADSIDMVRLIQSDVTNLELRAQKISFRYTATSLIEPEKVLFQYKLEGYDTTWVDAGTRREAQFMNLQRGRSYTFRVRACNNDGVWNLEGASLQFYLLPYWYETWWFYSLCGASALAFGFVLYKQR
ncbi:MAG: hypothetical protein MUF71_21785, partial [Candidatus Kapabacteria bacterium]|nr:hypothetical protein [Candidatus Kapabacteria bacterium]